MSGGKKPRRVAVLPARGGSKRIPRKNVRPFAGKPMVSYSIECALASELFDQVVVSTDDAEIADVAKRLGARVPFTRPAELSGDVTGVMPVMAHATRFLFSDGPRPESVCCIYPTAPFLHVDDLARGVDLLERSGLQFVLGATTFDYPVFRSFRVKSGGGLEMVFPQHAASRSQDLPDVLHDAGQFCWGRADAWIERQTVFGDDSGVVQIPRWRVQDIDTEEDWVRAELMFQAMRSHARS